MKVVHQGMRVVQSGGRMWSRAVRFSLEAGKWSIVHLCCWICANLTLPFVPISHKQAKEISPVCLYINDLDFRLKKTSFLSRHTSLSTDTAGEETVHTIQKATRRDHSNVAHCGYPLLWGCSGNTCHHCMAWHSAAKADPPGPMKKPYMVEGLLLHVSSLCCL